MLIGIIDADLIGRSKHNFPNLACMKISSYYKSKGHWVDLLTDYTQIQAYDLVFISKVFTDTPIDCKILTLPNVKYGGTGFFYDKAEPLPDEIEHIMPDYHLYDQHVNTQLSKGVKPKDLQYYTDYSIGYATRGCIRGCSFCVNKNYKKCLKHSSISEFLDSSRKYICLLDDNVLACKDWKTVFQELNATGKRFQFKQGMDERLLTDEKCQVIFNANWIGDYIFAFDNIKDSNIIIEKLKLIRKHTKVTPKFYTFCGYNHDCPDYYTEDFWRQDITDLFKRISILMEYGAIPYVMRYKDYKTSPYASLYNTIAAWCNQPAFFKKLSFREYCEYCEKLNRFSPIHSLQKFEQGVTFPYFDLKWSSYNGKKEGDTDDK